MKGYEGLVKSEGLQRWPKQGQNWDEPTESLLPWALDDRAQDSVVGRLARERCECWYNPGEWMICWGVIPVIFSGDDHTDTPAGLQLGNPMKHCV